MKKLLAFAVLAIALAAPAWAGTQTVTLYVPGMTCVTCPITVKMALSKVDGVQNTEVSFETREAIVSFDDTKAKVADLTEATKNAGYPSTVKP
jgi:periplasmic mercuric ion binding protein